MVTPVDVQLFNDRGVVVQSAPHSPDGPAVYLGDLIAWPWRDPGPVPWRRRCGWSRSLGPDRRAVGVPGGCDFLLGKGEFQVTHDSVPMSIIGRPRSSKDSAPWTTTKKKSMIFG